MRRPRDSESPAESGSTPYSFFRVIAQTFGEAPGTLDAILKGTGVEPADLGNHRVAFNLAQQLRQIDNLNRLVGRDWVLKAPRLFAVTSHDALGVAILNAPTIRGSLKVIKEQLPKRVTRVRTSLVESKAGASLSISLGADLSHDQSRPLAEIFLLSTLRFVEALSPRPPVGIRLSFAAPEPDHASALRTVTGVEIDFHALSNSIFVPQAYLDIRSSFADPSLYAIACERLEQDARASRTSDGVRSNVARMLAGSERGRVDASLIARSLGLSTRTLTRKLGEAGTDFREMTDAELQRRAGSYLKSGAFTMAEIGERLGYADPTGFSRAMKRWRLADQA